MNPDSNAVDQNDDVDQAANDATEASATVVATTLIEEISIDGMCGVY